VTSTPNRPAQNQNRPATRTRATITITAIVLAAVIILFFIFAGLYSDWLWFQQVGYLKVLTTQWYAQFALFWIGFFAMALPIFVSIEVAFRWRPVYAKLNSQLDRYQQVVEPLRRLAIYGIPAVIGIFGGASAASRWQTVLEYFNRTSFGTKDPQFGFDVSFYVFDLPFWRGVVAFASAAIIIAIRRGWIGAPRDFPANGSSGGSPAPSPSCDMPGSSESGTEAEDCRPNQDWPGVCPSLISTSKPFEEPHPGYQATYRGRHVGPKPAARALRSSRS